MCTEEGGMLSGMTPGVKKLNLNVNLQTKKHIMYYDPVHLCLYVLDRHTAQC